MKFAQRIFSSYKFSTAKDTCLKDVHVQNKGKIVSFAGKKKLIQDIICQLIIQKAL
jgi:hypothetical protein